jgi:hypothetical protein
MQTMHYIGLDVYKRTIDYCVKDGSGSLHGSSASPLAGMRRYRLRSTTSEERCCTAVSSVRLYVQVTAGTSGV